MYTPIKVIDQLSIKLDKWAVSQWAVSRAPTSGCEERVLWVIELKKVWDGMNEQGANKALIVRLNKLPAFSRIITGALANKTFIFKCLPTERISRYYKLFKKTIGRK